MNNSGSFSVFYDNSGRPQVNAAEANIKKPEWLNLISNYHNLGNNPRIGNSVLDGDFYGLDDLETENPKVIAGWIDVWSNWITKFDIDGICQLYILACKRDIPIKIIWIEALHVTPFQI